MSKPPYMYDQITLFASLTDNPNIKASDTNLTKFFRRHLLQRAMSVFKASYPETWAENYVDYCLFESGYYAVLNTDRFGVIPQWCTLGGYNVMYQPTTAIVSNPLFKGMTRELTIGRNCEIVKLQPDYGGVMDTVGVYANMMSLAVESININLFNSHLAYVFASSNKNAANTYKAMYDQVAKGEPAVFVDKEFFKNNGDPAWQAFDQNLKSNYIATDLLGDLRSIENLFDTAMGIPNNTSTNKKERQIKDEVNANNIETYTRMDMILDNLKKCCKKVNRMFGINIDYEWRYKPDIEGSGTIEQSGSINNGAI